MSDVTRILDQINAGDAQAAEELLPLVYEELRRLASSKLSAEAPGQTLQATALVHEAYIRLVGGNVEQDWNNRGHFFAAAAEAMRRILIDRARNKKRFKRGGDRVKYDLDKVDVALDSPADAVLDLDEALNRLASVHGESAELVKLRFFAGLKQQEAAQALGIPRRTADRHWSFARAFLYKELDGVESR